MRSHRLLSACEFPGLLDTPVIQQRTPAAATVEDIGDAPNNVLTLGGEYLTLGDDYLFLGS